MARSTIIGGVLQWVCLAVLLVCWWPPTSGCEEEQEEPIPLFLSPYLENGNISAAHEASLVHLDAVPTSHAGYITVNQTLGNHLYFWLFPSQTNPQAPLLMWLNGGPGTSSLVGLFGLHGPVQIDLETQKLYPRHNNSWLEHFSLLYVDNPVGTGFSFSDSGRAGWRTTRQGYADDLFSFVSQFFQIFPEFRENEFYIGGQSYAGKYVPVLAHRIHEENLNNVSDIPLTGIYLGNPFFDPETATLHYYDVPYILGTVTLGEMKSYKQRMEQAFADAKNSSLRPEAVLEIIWSVSGVSVMSVYNFDDRGEWYELYSTLEGFLSLPETQAAIHAARTPDFHSFFPEIGDYLSNGDFIVPAKEELAVVMDNYKVLIYTGNYDVIVSSVAVDEGLKATEWSLKEEYNNITDRQTYWRDDGEQNPRLAYVSQTGSFCRVVIHGSGHFVPLDQPETLVEVIRDFVEYGCLQV